MTLTFVNVNTDSVHHYERSECPDYIVEFVQNELKKSGTLQLWNGWSVVLHHADAEQAHFDLILDGVTTTHCWVCLTDTASKAVWQKLIDARPLIMAMSEPPDTVPWLAISMALGSISIVTSTPERLLEAPAIEISMVWALMAN